VRSPSAYGYGRASWELNLGCNYDCEHCYLDLKRFEGLVWDQRASLLQMLRDADVVWLQMTGGEPLIDRLFAQSYACAWDLGMMISISTNVSRLWPSPPPEPPDELTGIHIVNVEETVLSANKCNCSASDDNPY
jgi:MoaA/NifB/PqqE/SkfB family radical SAM enzyme